MSLQLLFFNACRVLTAYLVNYWLLQRIGHQMIEGPQPTKR